MPPARDDGSAPVDEVFDAETSAAAGGTAIASAEEPGASATSTSHPIGFWFFFWGELAERSSYYGMRAILALYMVDRLGFSEARSGAAVHTFIAACYLLPLVGGWVADNFLGKYWTIVGFSVPYILGHVILGVESVPFLVAALALLAMGSGVIKPNISTLMGMTYDQQRPGQERLRSDAFAMFYGAINIGAAISSFAMPWIRTNYSYRLAFLFPAGLMVVAFAIFAAGKRFYAVESVARREKTPEERAAQRSVLARISGIFAVVAFVWTIQDQSASTWTFFARDYLNLHLFGPIDMTIFGRTFSIGTLEPDQIQGINPVLIVILLPLVTVFWHWLDRRGLKLRPTDKMVIGFVLGIVTMATMAAAGFLTSKEAKISVLWEIVAYVVITTAETCISVVGLELAFTAAPKHMKSFVTACWLLTIFAGDSLAIPLTWLYDAMSPGPYFSLLTLLMLAVTAAFVFVANRFNRAAA
jgi:POT family proton-dependent oligopeptide transporter